MEILKRMFSNNSTYIAIIAGVLIYFAVEFADITTPVVGSENYCNGRQGIKMRKFKWLFIPFTVV